MRRGVSEARADTCPKHMVYGPCGGVRAESRCEIDDRRCPFVDAPLVRWDGPAPPAPTAPLPWLERAARGEPFIMTDLRVRPYDPISIGDVVGRLAPVTDVVLVGEHHNRPDFPPSLMATFVAEAGGHPWVTLTCRDRNRVVLEDELHALAAVGAPGVHCVTGDARAAVRLDATQVFDLDGVRLAALARQIGLTVSVAATPAAPPLPLRPTRLVEKQRAGAQLCVVNHAGGSAAVAAFVAAARRSGATIPFVPCVAVFTDREALAVLDRFPGLVVDPTLRDAVLAAGDTRAAGIAAAVDEAVRMLDIDGAIGVNLSGSATSGSEIDGAAIMAEIAEEIRSRRR